MILLAGIILSLVPCAQAQGFKWETIKVGKMDYVTLRSVKTFYFFDKISLGKQIVLYRSAKIIGGQRKVEVEMKFRSGSKSCHMNGVYFVLSHSILQRGGRYLISRTDLVKLVDPVLRPAHIKNAKPFDTVVIDAGHGGRDSGSLGLFGVHEKYYALKVARMVRDMLQKRGYKVVMTRDRDVFISLDNRVKIANRYPSAICISIHFNSAQRQANGIETFTVSPVGVPHMGRGVRAKDFRMVPGNIADSASIALATAVHSRTVRFLNGKDGMPNNFRVADRGIKRARFNMLAGIRIPAILLEGGFISNREEARKVHQSAYQQTIAIAVVEAVKVYRNSISRR